MHMTTADTGDVQCAAKPVVLMKMEHFVAHFALALSCLTLSREIPGFFALMGDSVIRLLAA